MILSPFFLFDLQNFATLFRKPKHTNLKCFDYTVLVPINSRPIERRLFGYLTKIKEKVIIVDDTNGNGEKYREFLKREKFKIIKKEGNGFKWGALKYALNFVKTKYTIFLDDDTIPKRDFSNLVGILEKENADLTSVRVFADRNKKLIEKLQDIEYKIAMLARQNRKWITSGACICGKTESLRKIMDSHSLFREGGDIETGLLAKKMGMKIHHSEFEVYTEIPSTFKSWFSQRMKWMGGNFRHNVINFGKQFPDIIHIFYFSIVVWLLLLVKIFLIIMYPKIFLMVILAYIPITFISNLKIIKNLSFIPFLLFPIYAIFQVTVLAVFGMAYYFRSALEQRNIGRIKVRKI